MGILCNRYCLLLQTQVYHVIDRFSFTMGKRVITVILCIVLVDYIIQLLHAFKVDLNRPKDAILERYRSFKARWY